MGRLGQKFPSLVKRGRHERIDREYHNDLYTYIYTLYSIVDQFSYCTAHDILLTVFHIPAYQHPQILMLGYIQKLDVTSYINLSSSQTGTSDCIATVTI